MTILLDQDPFLVWIQDLICIKINLIPSTARLKRTVWLVVFTYIIFFSVQRSICAGLIRNIASRTIKSEYSLGNQVLYFLKRFLLEYKYSDISCTIHFNLRDKNDKQRYPKFFKICLSLLQYSWEILKWLLVLKF